MASVPSTSGSGVQESTTDMKEHKKCAAATMQDYAESEYVWNEMKLLHKFYYRLLY